MLNIFNVNVYSRKVTANITMRFLCLKISSNLRPSNTMFSQCKAGQLHAIILMDIFDRNKARMLYGCFPNWKYLGWVQAFIHYKLNKEQVMVYDLVTPLFTHRVVWPDQTWSRILVLVLRLIITGNVRLDSIQCSVWRLTRPARLDWSSSQLYQGVRLVTGHLVWSYGDLRRNFWS